MRVPTTVAFTPMVAVDEVPLKVTLPPKASGAVVLAIACDPVPLNVTNPVPDVYVPLLVKLPPTVNAGLLLVPK